MKSLGCQYPYKKIDDEMVDISVLPLSMDDASIEAVVEIAVLMVDAEEQFFQYPSTKFSSSSVDVAHHGLS